MGNRSVKGQKMKENGLYVISRQLLKKLYPFYFGVQPCFEKFPIEINSNYIFDSQEFRICLRRFSGTNFFLRKMILLVSSR